MLHLIFVVLPLLSLGDPADIRGHCVAPPGPVVRTPLGDVEGLRYEDINVFLGIRYATAERFHKPEPVQRWNTTYPACAYGLACHVFTDFPYKDRTSDDCLFLNIFAPSTPSFDPSGYPVLVFIHGGGFAFGLVSSYPYEIISENFAKRGVIFVTLNYRVGPFGFFATGNSEAPGNNGLWDQTAALQFVKRVIGSFGGNSGRITVAGHSAGSICLTALTLSTHSRDLFQQAIMMSGSLFSSSILSDRVVNQSAMVARRLGCDRGFNVSATLACLRNISGESYNPIYSQLSPLTEELIGSRFGPHLDGVFLSADLRKLLETAVPKPTIMGITDMEAGLFVMIPGSFPVSIPKSERNSYDGKKLEKLLLKYYGSPPQLHQLVKEFYIDRTAGNMTRNSTSYLTILTKLASDVTFVVPVLQEADSKKRAGWPMFLYLQEGVDTEHEDFSVWGTFHNTEIQHLLHRVAESDYEKSLLEGFISFVKTGRPAVKGTPWKPTSASNPGRHFIFGAQNRMAKEDLMKDTAELWLQKIPYEMRKLAVPLI
ncbi:hypothetical protein L596_016213 [Steinernema carpocapsae]|uniref:Carboxylic ester hydrolase n=1 Tax=Steinernema carpocapsae TaxID=34508 RepID=A0A4U5NIE5_STECR|nr:hypothetical protein L596_016213 [Steinernema carpocapsae]